jgi:glycosyltransferase involved in cell wall biosynthesis
MPDRRRRIALVTDAIGPYHHGGKEQRYLQLAPRLAAKADVHVYTMKWWQGPRVRRHDGVTYHAISPRIALYAGSRRSIVEAVVFALCCLGLVTAKFDVLEADHMPYIPLFTLKLVTVVRRRRLVVTWHECWGPTYWRTYLGLAGRFGWMFESLAMRLPDTIIAASPQTAARLQEVLVRQIPVIVAPNGIDMELIRRVPRAQNPVDVIVVGRLLAHKRVDLLLAALALLDRDGRRVTAQVVGAGPELRALRDEARSLQIADNVEFRQDIDSHEELYAALKAARVAVFPSEREGFGVAVLEALACGVPVVTTSAPDNLARHLVTRSVGAGVVCDPNATALADAIAAVLDGDAQPSESQEWLAEYDWASITEDVAAALA